MAHRLRIGLTGGIASGKSTVAERFVEWGVPVIDADRIARDVVMPGQPGLAQIVGRFGAGILDATGELDRRALRNRVFSDATQRRDLEAILHPLIRAEMDRRAAAAQGEYVVLAIPLLVEGGRDPDRVDRVLVIDVTEETQIRRVMSRDSTSREHAEAVLAAQASRAARLAIADDVLVNSGTVPELRQGVDRLHQHYLRLAGAGAQTNQPLT